LYKYDVKEGIPVLINVRNYSAYLATTLLQQTYTEEYENFKYIPGTENFFELITFSSVEDLDDLLDSMNEEYGEEH
jgi:hypothetical protein